MPTHQRQSIGIEGTTTPTSTTKKAAIMAGK